MTTKLARKERISAILPRSMVFEVRKTALDQNVPQSTILEQAINLWLKNKLDKDTLDLSKISFDDLPNEDTWLEIQSQSNNYD
jgi:hypothetical protein